MLPSNFKESNCTLDPPDGVSVDDVQPLCVYRDGTHVISCWRPTKEELEEINRTGRVWLWIWGRTMPPALLTGDNPFEQAEVEGGG